MLSPSMLGRATAGSLQVAGRLLLRDGSRLRIADAFTALDVDAQGCEVDDVSEGEWLNVRGDWDGSELKAVEVQRLSRGSVRTKGEWSRLQQRGRAANLRLRAKVLRGIRDFFETRDSLEVNTPAAVPCPGMDPHLAALRVANLDARWLATSPEYQMKRLLAAGLPRIHQIGSAFRAEEEGALHAIEFTMLEWYRAFASSDELMDETEALIRELARFTQQATLDIPFERITIEEAFRRHGTLHLNELDLDGCAADRERFFRAWVDEIEKHLGSERPTFVTHWPASMASLARLLPEDPRHADRFELYMDGIEICNGFGELIDPRQQRSRFEADAAERRRMGLMTYPLDERFLQALEEGLPPCSGNALGVDRLIMLLTGAKSIEDVMALSPREL